EDLERVPALIQVWSDSAHLANFGTASVWPIYVQFGNQSKYTRARPTAKACHHLAYIPSISDSAQDRYTRVFGKPATNATLTHLKRELVHGIWETLTDAEFIQAYHHGLVVTCDDGIRRRIFPRFYTYSADYPEKMLMSGLKFYGKCPCPRCLVAKDKINKMGTKPDMYTRTNKIRVDNHRRQDTVERARKLMFDYGLSVGSDRVNEVLAGSMVPTRNAFSKKLSEYGFDFHEMFVVDLLHEFELGVWKGVFTHLMRLLYAAAGDAIQTLNERYRAMPTFGRDTIRKFHRNASGMKKLAARDFEDLLQCAIPVFEGLFPSPHNNIVLNLLFDLSTWHAYAKLRLHTDKTLEFFDDATTALGEALRTFFKKTCSVYDTKELPQEEAARGRRHAAMVQKNKTAGLPEKPQSASKSQGSKRKIFNMFTAKTHFLGDYPRTVRQRGTTDSYNTQLGELEHKVAKRRYARTSKNKFTPQLAKLEVRERLIAKINIRIGQHIKKDQVKEKRRKRKAAAAIARSGDPLPFTDPKAHFHIAESTRNGVDITAWLSENRDDPAVKDFLPRLQDHILGRLQGREYDGDEHEFTDADRNTVLFVNNKMYMHSVIRVNYTTYDMRRQQDSVNPRTHPDIMVLSREDGAEAGADDVHPFWYARVVRIFHVEVRHRGPASTSFNSRRMDVLWIRWFGLDMDAPGGWATKRLHGVSFIPDDDGGAFGFLDPDQVIRGVHLLPAFHFGRTTLRLGPSIARKATENDEDYEKFYVGMFVDRDMFMRYRGGGVGHRGTRFCNTALLRDQHVVLADESDSDGGDESEEEDAEEDEEGEEEGEEDGDNEGDNEGEEEGDNEGEEEAPAHGLGSDEDSGNGDEGVVGSEGDGAESNGIVQDDEGEEAGAGDESDGANDDEGGRNEEDEHADIYFYDSDNPDGYVEVNVDEEEESSDEEDEGPDETDDEPLDDLTPDEAIFEEEGYAPP
ncbi:hypothetical protein BV25DRAFT_453896, partial [Artomyces pyxidatus]